jgi:hypothetical protein
MTAPSTQPPLTEQVMNFPSAEKTILAPTFLGAEPQVDKTVATASWVTPAANQALISSTNSFILRPILIDGPQPIKLKAQACKNMGFWIVKISTSLRQMNSHSRIHNTKV